MCIRAAERSAAHGCAGRGFAELIRVAPGMAGTVGKLGLKGEATGARFLWVSGAVQGCTNFAGAMSTAHS